jgi:hypothetical protein
VNITDHSILSLVWKGQVPVIKNERKMWVDKYDLDAWVERMKTTHGET